jgi:hypothetical protein
MGQQQPQNEVVGFLIENHDLAQPGSRAKDLAQQRENFVLDSGEIADELCRQFYLPLMFIFPGM